MKDLHMFNKLFFVLATSLLITLSSPSVAKEPTYHTILGSGGTKYKVFGTEQTARTILNELTSEGSERLQDLRTAQLTFHGTYKKKRLAKNQREQRRRIMLRRAAEKKQEDFLKNKQETRKKYIQMRKKNRLNKLRISDKIKIEMSKREEAARIKREAFRKQQLVEKIISVSKKYKWEKNKPKNPNIIKSITKDGQVRTLYCNPGPCTPGSILLHENISGLEMGVDVNTLAKRIETNAAQKKRQDNTNENNAKTAEDMASLGTVSLDTLFEQSEADLDETNDISLTRALSIPKSQVEKNKESHKDSVKNSNKNKEAETDYVKNADEIKQYCLYEGC